MLRTRWLLAVFFVVFGSLDLGNAACPNAWDSWSTFCYLFNQEDGTWEDAEQRCAALGSHLASSHSAFENHFILGKAFEHFNKAGVMWIGGDNFNSNTQLYTWTDGTTFDYEFWKPHEPPSKGEYCIAMTYQNARVSIKSGYPGEWQAEKCGTRLPFVCKMNAT
uniref:C-type lectin domain-containing protein n=1 Tax=Plectus sambesii TaxID=2011161 RepID=A0A914VK35_9BILA